MMIRRRKFDITTEKDRCNKMEKTRTTRGGVSIKIFNRGSLASGRCDQSLNVRPVNEQRLVAQVGR